MRWNRRTVGLAIVCVWMVLLLWQFTSIFSSSRYMDFDDPVDEDKEIFVLDEKGGDVDDRVDRDEIIDGIEKIDDVHSDDKGSGSNEVNDQSKGKDDEKDDKNERDFFELYPIPDVLGTRFQLSKEEMMEIREKAQKVRDEEQKKHEEVEKARERPKWLDDRTKKAYEFVSGLAGDYPPPENIREFLENFEKGVGHISLSSEYCKWRGAPCDSSDCFPPEALAFGSIKSCAIVSGSKKLLNSGYGPDIDAHEAVFRVNRHESGSLGKDIGTKTTHRVAGCRSFMRKGEPVEFIWFHNQAVLDRKDFAAKSIQKCGDVAATQRSSMGYSTEYHLVVPELTNFTAVEGCHRKFDRQPGPSTGFHALFLALQMCRQVSLYCMESMSYGTSDFWKSNYDAHYTGGNSGMLNKIVAKRAVESPFSEHCWWHEKEWINEMRRQGIVQYFCKRDTTEY